jgi:hypothetical protein
MNDHRLPSDAVCSALLDLETQGVIMTWEGPNMASNGRRRWSITYADGSTENLQTGQVWAFVKGARAATLALIGVEMGR